MVEPTLNCNTCEHQAKAADEAPCLTCSWWGNWEAKQTRTCETCLHWPKEADEAPCVTCTMERASWEPSSTRSCNTCLHEARDADEAPCITCKLFGRWEPKQIQQFEKPMSVSIDEYIERIGKGEMTVEQGLNGTTAKDLYDTISKPKHYMLFAAEDLHKDKGIEVRDVIEKLVDKCYSDGLATQGSSLFLSDYVQLMQYLMRFMDKNGKEDLKKARWYLDKMIESY